MASQEKITITSASGATRASRSWKSTPLRIARAFAFSFYEKKAISAMLATCRSRFLTLTLLVLAAASPAFAQTPTGAAPASTKLVNVATRLPVGTADEALIGGFILTGTQSKRVIIRAIGPSLNLADKLANPRLELFTGQTSLAMNDDWENSAPPDRQAVIDSGIPPSNSFESAIVRTLPASPSGIGYTAVVRGAKDTTGIAVVEVYDLNPSADSRLANISTRGSVQTGDNALFAGTFVAGEAPQKVIIRAIGPSLTIAGKMQNPTLQLLNAQGTELAFNDNWKTRPDGSSQQAEIEATGVAPPNDFESAIVVDLAASTSGTSYSAIIRGAGGETGIALVEMYALQ
jgi:hypothetical protein